jgi:hypothetical protein
VNRNVDHVICDLAAEAHASSHITHLLNEQMAPAHDQNKDVPGAGWHQRTMRAALDRRSLETPAAIEVMQTHRRHSH